MKLTRLLRPREMTAYLPAAAGLRYFLEMSTAKDVIHVWSSRRDGEAPTLDEKFAAVTYDAMNDAYLPLD